MVVGDSLAQGVRSLSFRPEFAGQCVGARLADLQGWPFRSQTHPRHVLLDVEGEVRRLNLVGALFYRKLIEEICARVNENFQAWVRDLIDALPQLDLPPFDNLAVGAALIVDMLTPAREWRAVIEANRGFRLTMDNVLNGFGLAIVGALFKAINYAYILNPGRNPAWEDFSALDWLRERQPKRVLVTVGHNESLWDVGFTAADTEVSVDDLRGLEAVSQRLAALEADWVCWDLLPKVSAVANLNPVSTEWTGGGAGKPNNYCKRYQPVLSVSGAALEGPRLRAIDASIVETNDAVIAKLGGAFEAAGHTGRLRFFDDYKFFSGFDFKNQANGDALASQKLRVEFAYQKRFQRVDNRYIYADYREVPAPGPFPGKTTFHAKQVVAGGIQSLDGIHPSGVGYMLKALKLTEQADLGLKAVRIPDAALAKAFEQDTLTKDFPTVVNTLRLFLRALQKIKKPKTTRAMLRAEALAKDEEQACAIGWVELMSSTMRQG